MECRDEFGNVIELYEHPYTMPTRVILEADDRPEEVIKTLQTRFTDLVDEFAAQERSRYYSRETRYDDGMTEPSFPIIMGQLATSTRVPSTVVLPDGRKALLLDPHRVQTQCGIQEIFLMTQLQHMRPHRKGTRMCSQCKGKHLAESPTTPLAPPPARPTIPCAKCQANLLAASYWDGPDTLVCIPCGTRISRPLTRLTTEEEEANQLAVTHATVLDPPSAHDDRIDDETDLLEDSAESHDSEETDSADITEDRVSPYEDDFTIGLLPETTPLDQAELDEIQTMLANPHRRWLTDEHSIVIQHLLAMTTQRLTVRDDDQAFKETFAQVVGEEIGHLGDLLHLPACQLFKSSQSPLRQGLVDRAIQHQDEDARRMAVWAAAGRFLNETNIPWLKDFHAAADPTRIPTQKKDRAEFWRQLQTTTKAEVSPILDWLNGLSREDLALLSGDPDTSHPFVHHPDPEVFQGTETLLNPLIAFLANELHRFRQKESGCVLLAGDYGLDVESLRTIALQSGQLRLPPQAPTAAAA